MTARFSRLFHFLLVLKTDALHIVSDIVLRENSS